MELVEWSSTSSDTYLNTYCKASVFRLSQAFKASFFLKVFCLLQTSLRKLTCTVSSLLSVMSAVILPTIWRYLQTLGAAPYFLGLGLSAFSLSGLLSGPLFGHWSDRTRTTKNIILFANLFEIVGESQYPPFCWGTRVCKHF